MMAFILSLCRVLMAGESLANPAIWKNRQQAVNALVIIAGVMSPLLSMLGLTADDVLTLVTGIAIIGGFVNGYLTVATTDKIGFRCSRGES